jgi:HK97 family phage major capsid protein
MKQLQELYTEKLQIHAQMKDLAARVEKENRSAFTKEEDDAFKRMNEAFTAKEAEIRSMEQYNESRKLLIDREGAPAPEVRSMTGLPHNAVNTTDKKAQESEAYERAFDRYARKGYSSLNEEERGAISKGFQGDPELRSTSGQLVGTDNVGGYLVADTWAARLYEVMKWYGGAIEANYGFTTATGATFNLPKEDDTANTGAIITELTEDVVLDVPYANIAIGAHTYTSKIIKISYELLQDNSYDLQGRISKIAGTRIGRALNAHLTTGNGTTQPQGFITGASAGATAADDVTISRNDFLNLIHSVDVANRFGDKVGFQMHDNTLLALKKLAVGSGDDRPLWVPSMRDGAPDKIEGYRYWINNDMATIAASAKAVAFGNFDDFHVRTVKGVTLLRLTERYAETRAVGFIAHARFDAKVVNSAAIKYLTMAAS